MGIPKYNSNVNLTVFPQLGAFPNEVGSGLSPGGIGGPWISNIPIPYWFGYGRKTGRSKTGRSKARGKSVRKTGRSKTGRKSGKISKKKFNKYLQKKIRKNMEEYEKGRWKSRKQALAVSYSQARKKFE